MRRDSGPRSSALDEFYMAVLAEGAYTSRRRLRFHLDSIFEGIDFPGCRVLDVGGGDGLLSFYAAARGAREVICLEPELAGSKPHSVTTFEKLADRLGMRGTVCREPLTFQEFEDSGTGFDLVVLKASINHLDEHACANLLREADCRATYSRIALKLASLSNKDARLIVCDCSSRNFFARLGVRNPLAPSIEWHKHQPPEVWAALFEESGFVEPRLRWNSFNALSRPGRVLFGNRTASYFLTSAFCLTMTKA